MNYDKRAIKPILFLIVMVAVIGGLLFGYDTAVISGAEKGLQAFFMGAKDFVYSDAIHGITSSSALIGCIIGSAISGLLASNLGRKKTLFIAGICYLLSALGSLLSGISFLRIRQTQSRPAHRIQFLPGIRRIEGVGLASAICPMYIAEIAPSNIRGTLSVVEPICHHLRTTCRLLCQLPYLGRQHQSRRESHRWSKSNLKPRRIDLGYRNRLAPGCSVAKHLPAALFSLLVLLVPETPRYLAMTGRDEKALSVLSRINGIAQAKIILARHQSHCSRKNRKTVYLRLDGVASIGIMLSVFQQAVGINAVLYFAPRIFESMGMGNPMIQTVIMGIVNISFTLVAVFSRRKNSVVNLCLSPVP